MVHTIRFPCGTAEVLLFTGLAEYQVNNLIRAAKIEAPPTIRGRRFWAAADVLGLVAALGLKLTPAKRRALEVAAEQEQEASGARR